MDHDPPDVTDQQIPTPFPSAILKTCPHCGFLSMPQDPICPRCKLTVDADMTPVVLDTTHQLKRHPTLVGTSGTGTLDFAPEQCAVLQVLPSAACIVLSMDQPVTLGRGDHEVVPFLDLSPYQAAHHGISRHHCLLFREANRLYVIDLLSTNGTLLDGDRLTPEVAYAIADGARLILGTLHLFIFFMAYE